MYSVVSERTIEGKALAPLNSPAHGSICHRWIGGYIGAYQIIAHRRGGLFKGFLRAIETGLTPSGRDDVSYGFLIMLLFWSKLACQSTRWIQYFILVLLP
jgi:hypothetical protein